MPWLFLLLALIALALTFKAGSMFVAALCLLAAFVFLVLWVVTLAAKRVGDRSRDDALLIDPVELRRLREQAAAKRAANGTHDDPPVS